MNVSSKTGNFPPFITNSLKRSALPASRQPGRLQRKKVVWLARGNENTGDFLIQAVDYNYSNNQSLHNYTIKPVQDPPPSLRHWKR